MHTRIDFYSLGDLTTQLENLDTVRQARKENRAEAWRCWLVCLSYYGNGGPLRILREQGVLPEVLVAGPGLRALVQEHQGGEAECPVRSTTESIQAVAQAITGLRRRKSVLDQYPPRIAKATVDIFLRYVSEPADPRRSSAREGLSIVREQDQH